MAYDGSVNSDGWSNVLNYYKDRGNPRLTSSYEEFPSTWYTRSYFSSYTWAKMYINRSELRQKLKLVKFKAIPGYSGNRNGQPAQFFAWPGALTGPVRGYGCSWRVVGYLVDGGQFTSETCDMPNISHPNSSAYGYCPNVSTTDYTATDFGNPGFNYNIEHNGAIRYYTVDFNNNALWIEPGQRLFIHLEPFNWKSGSTNTNSLIKFTHNGEGFEAEFEDEPSNFIWRFNASKQQWERVLPVWQCQNQGGQKIWTKLTGG